MRVAGSNPVVRSQIKQIGPAIVRHILQSSDWLSDKPALALFDALDTQIFGSREAKQWWDAAFTDVAVAELAGANHFLQEDVLSLSLKPSGTSLPTTRARRQIKTIGFIPRPKIR